MHVSLVQGLEEHIFQLTVHHIASDGWSAGILDRELRGQFIHQLNVAMLAEEGLLAFDPANVLEIYAIAMGCKAAGGSGISGPGSSKR